MKTIVRSLVMAVALGAAGVASPAQAQMGPYNSPVSPYQNLLYPGMSPGVNFYNLVQPQIEFNNAIGALQAGQGALGQALTGSLTGATTGHPVQFGNYSHYYGRGIGSSRGSLGGGGMMGGMGGMMGGMGGMMGGMGGMGGMMGGMGGMGGMMGGMGGMMR